jgi:hypothetical protein
MMIRNILKNIIVPPDWTGEQALAVVDFLDEINTAIWEMYDDEIIDAMQKKDSLLIRAARGHEEEACPPDLDPLYDKPHHDGDDPFDDDIPF